MKPPYTHLSLDMRRELFRLRSTQISMRVSAQPEPPSFDTLPWDQTELVSR